MAQDILAQLGVFYIIGGIIAVPLIGLGLHRVIIWFYHNHLEKKGHVEIGLKKENYQVEFVWVRPVDKEFKRKYGDEERTFTFSNLPGDCLYKGRRLYALFDEKTGEQISFLPVPEESQTMSSQDKNQLLKRVYNLGVNIGSAAKGNTAIILYIILGILILSSAFNFYKLASWDTIIKSLAK